MGIRSDAKSRLAALRAQNQSTGTIVNVKEDYKSFQRESVETDSAVLANPSPRTRRKHLLNLTFFVLGLCALFHYVYHSLISPSPSHPHAKPPPPPAPPTHSPSWMYPNPTSPLNLTQIRNWAQYTPFIPLAPYHPPPPGCLVSQINLLERHGARYPTLGATLRIGVALNKLLHATAYVDERLAFLRDEYEYDLGVDDLVPFGAEQSRQSGKTHRARYPHLFSHPDGSYLEPFIRSDVSQRVVASARHWAAGTRPTAPPPISVIISGKNNTLDDHMCPNAAGSGSHQKVAWTNVYAPRIAARLNAWAPGAVLEAHDIFDLMSLCPFDTVAKGVRSPWCGVFNDSEHENGKEDPDSDWDGFEYTGDLDKYYGTGHGALLGRVQGVGYVNELLARLTGRPVEDRTQTNSTLDGPGPGSEKTFPLGRRVYADFSHDNEMVAIYAALGLFRQPGVEPLAVGRPDGKRRWRADRLVPFSARMVVEKVVCDGEDKETDHVRILVNDELQPLPFCATKDEVDVDMQMCTLDAFVESQVYSREAGQGDWEKCF